MGWGAPSWARTPNLLPAPCEPHSLCKVRRPHHSRTRWIPQSCCCVWARALGKGLPHARDHIRLVHLPEELLIPSVSVMKIPMVT